MEPSATDSVLGKRECPIDVESLTVIREYVSLSLSLSLSLSYFVVS